MTSSCRRFVRTWGSDGRPVPPACLSFCAIRLRGRLGNAMITADSEQESRRILIVEDSPTQAARLRRTLETNGYRTQTAANGREALERIAQQPPDLVISDVLMPEMDGYEFCAQVKKSPELRRIPVVLLTALDRPYDIIQGLRCGADNFMIKPYDSAQLLTRLRGILANAEARRPAQPEPELEVEFAGEKVLLSADRMQILDLLLVSFQTIVARTQTLEQRTFDLTQALQTIQKLERDQRELLDCNGDGILVLDAHGALRYTNPAARILLGARKFSPQDLLARVPSGNADVTEADLPGDSPCTVEVRAKPVEWEGAAARLVTLHDVTARKQALAQLEQLRQEQLRARDEFLSHVSHELRAPLGAIYQFVTILLDGLAGAVTDEQRQYLGIIYRNTQQLRNMIEDLLQANRAQTGKMSVSLQRVDLPPLLAELAETLRQSAQEQQLALTVDAPGDLPPVLADPLRVRQILNNLLGNAFKFTPAGGSIRVTARATADSGPADAARAMVVISVADTGCGIGAEDCRRIFDQLYQVERTRTRSRNGLGLGLFISRDLVARQGGRIWVESEPGRGATFFFTLPAQTPGAAT